MPFDRVKTLYNNQPYDMGFIPHLSFIHPIQTYFVGYNYLGVG